MNWAILLGALIAVESGGNPSLIGDGGKAVGVLQIHDCVLDDVNRIYSFNYTHADMKCPIKSRMVCVHYLRYYIKQSGEPPSYELAARIWVGGPQGYRKRATIPYWNKVKQQLRITQ